MGLALCAVCVTGCHSRRDQAGQSAATASASMVRSSAPAPVASAPVTGVKSAGAKGAGAKGVAPDKSETADPASRTGAPKGAPGPEVKLLSAGAAPLHPLRYHFKKGQVERVQLVSRTGMTIQVEGHAIPSQAMPALEMTAVVRVLSVAADGAARRELGIENVHLEDEQKVPRAMRQSVERSLEGLEKLKGHDTVDTRGRLRSVELDTSALKNDQLAELVQSMRSAFGQMSAPFPGKPVGKGARWRVSTHVEQMGMKLKQVATYTLDELDGDHGTLGVQLEQSVAGSHIEIPGAPLGVSSDLLGMSGTGKGRIQFDLGRSVPKGSITTRSSTQVRTSMAGKSQDMQMDMTLTETFKPL